MISYLASIMREAWTDSELVEGILAHDDKSLHYLYNSLFGKVEAFVLKNNGSATEAKDVFQDGVIALYQNLESGRYQLRSSVRLTSYLFQICKFQWYSVLRTSHKKSMIGSIDIIDPEANDMSFNIDTKTWDENRLVRDAIDRLGESCRNLLLAFYYDEKSMKEIAAALGQQTNSVKNAKYRCMKKLKELIKSRQA